MKDLTLEIFSESTMSGQEGRIPTGVRGHVGLMAGKVVGLRYPGRPDVVKTGETLEFGIGGHGAHEFYVPEDVAKRTHSAFIIMLSSPRGLTREQAAWGLCSMAGVGAPEHVEYPGDQGGVKHRWQKPSLGDLKLETGYVAVDGEGDNPPWPFWTLGDKTRALTYVPDVGLATVRLIDMIRVGNFIRPLAEL